MERKLQSALPRPLKTTDAVIKEHFQKFNRRHPGASRGPVKSNIWIPGQARNDECALTIHDSLFTIHRLHRRRRR